LVTNRSISQSHWENNRTGKRDQQFESPIPWQFQVTILCTGLLPAIRCSREVPWFAHYRRSTHRRLV